MSAEAIARLREHVDYVFKDGELPESESMTHDLRALLDAYDEVLDALEAEVPAEARPHMLEQANASFDAHEISRCEQSNQKRARLLAVLAKAGR